MGCCGGRIKAVARAKSSYKTPQPNRQINVSEGIVPSDTNPKLVGAPMKIKGAYYGNPVSVPSSEEEE